MKFINAVFFLWMLVVARFAEGQSSQDTKLDTYRCGTAVCVYAETFHNELPTLTVVSLSSPQGRYVDGSDGWSSTNNLTYVYLQIDISNEAGWFSSSSNHYHCRHCGDWLANWIHFNSRHGYHYVDWSELPDPPVRSTLKTSAYIPVGSIDGPAFCFRDGVIPYQLRYNGNNRGPSFWAWSSKATTFNEVEAGFAYYWTRFYASTSESRSYSSDTPTSGGSNGPFVEQPNDPLGDCLFLHEAGAYGFPVTDISTSSPGPRSVQTQQHVQGFNPLIPYSLPLDWTFTWQVQGTIPPAKNQTVFGYHDCFPAYEMYVEGQLAHHHTPSSYSASSIAMCLAGFNTVNFSVSR
jgi:hypothetical protein